MLGIDLDARGRASATSVLAAGAGDAGARRRGPDHRAPRRRRPASTLGDDADAPGRRRAGPGASSTGSSRATDRRSGYRRPDRRRLARDRRRLASPDGRGSRPPTRRIGDLTRVDVVLAAGADPAAVTGSIEQALVTRAIRALGPARHRGVDAGVHRRHPGDAGAAVVHHPVRGGVPVLNTTRDDGRRADPRARACSGRPARPAASSCASSRPRRCCWAPRVGDRARARRAARGLRRGAGSARPTA